MLGHWSKPVTWLATIAYIRESLTHACNSNMVINLPKEGKLKNLPGKAEGNGAHDWWFSLLFTAEKKLLTTKKSMDAGLNSTVGERALGAGAAAGWRQRRCWWWRRLARLLLLPPPFLFFYVFSSPSFLCCCLCYYWKTKTMVDGDGGLNRGRR